MKKNDYKMLGQDDGEKCVNVVIAGYYWEKSVYIYTHLIAFCLFKI